MLLSVLSKICSYVTFEIQGGRDEFLLPGAAIAGFVVTAGVFICYYKLYKLIYNFIYYNIYLYNIYIM